MDAANLGDRGMDADSPAQDLPAGDADGAMIDSSPPTDQGG